MDELIELSKDAGFFWSEKMQEVLLDADDERPIVLTEQLTKFASLIEAKQAERIAKLEAALIKLLDCDWVVTWADRMDAVRDIAKEALDAN